MSKEPPNPTELLLSWENEQKRVSEVRAPETGAQNSRMIYLNTERPKMMEGLPWPSMRSVSISPEEQGNPDNIQFLSHEEHIEHISFVGAHKLYYDPVTNSELISRRPHYPCKVIDLSAPVVKIEV